MSEIQASQKIAKPGEWGRACFVEIQTIVGCLAIFTLSPLLVIYYYLVAFNFEGSLLAPLTALYSGELSFQNLWDKMPSFSYKALYIFAFWFGLQLFLSFVPDYLHRFLRFYQGGHQLGSTTPAGNRLSYNINGLQAWIVSHVLFLIGAFGLGWYSPNLFFEQWGSLLIIANVVGFALAFFVYIKAHFFPTCAKDRKFSGNALYDFFMGVELNPRIGSFDFKLFFNGRPGIVAWTLINLSFVFEQYARYGYVTNSLILVNILHGIYVLYFFWKEAWYLNTIDIHHDHFGWMLAWGDCVWLPYMYTLQGLFLVFHPIQLSTGYACFVLSLGLIGFWIFLASNNQKDRFRRTNGKTLIWNERPKFIPCQYHTKDGEVRQSKLLTSGWWGIARHTNYTGDLILSLAYSLPCGFGYFFPYFYFVFILILLVHRCLRDEHRCRHKYGKAWDEYCAQVPYRFIPGVF